jgi:hypothetical protein
MRPIDADSLLRLIRIRQTWHKELDVDEVIEMIKQAPPVTEICTKDARKEH